MQCISHAESDDANEVDMSCTGAERGVNKYGNPPKGEQFVFNLQYTKVFLRRVRAVDSSHGSRSCTRIFSKFVLAGLARQGSNYYQLPRVRCFHCGKR